MKLTAQQRRIARDILCTPSDDFASLVQAARLDRTRAFREADLRHVDFGTADLERFDFSGADLRGADLSRARNKDAAVFAGVVADATTRGLPLPPPPADFDLKEATRVILAGTAPPAPWFPYITKLSFRGEALSDLTPLAGLPALQTLDLDRTQVSDLTPLAALNALQELSLNSTQVSDVSILRQKGLRIYGPRDDAKKNTVTGVKKLRNRLSAAAGRLLRTKT